MQEFEEMKRNEVKQMFDNQVDLIDKFKVEQSKNFDQIRERAENIKVTTSNAVRAERMNLELAKTANYNKFTKEEQEKLKKEEEYREQRYYEMQYFDN